MNKNRRTRFVSLMLAAFLSVLPLADRSNASGISDFETKIPGEKKTNFWKIEPWPENIEVQLQGKGLKRRHSRDTELPDQTVVYIKSHQKKLKLVHSGGHQTTISGPGIYKLDESYLWKNSNQLRTALDILPSNLIQEQPKNSSRMENMLSFFVPRVPFAEQVPARINGPDDKTTQPIRPLFPPPVHFIETNSLPVQISLEWIIETGQIDPHSVYLWSESHFVSAPNAVVRGGRGVISLSKYGRYYWQIEDASQRFLSTPRTIIVVRPGGTPDDDSEETKETIKTNADKQLKEKIIGGMQLSSPRHRSHYFACNVSSKQQVQVPIQIQVQRGEFSSLEVEVLPAQSTKAIKLEIGDNQGKVVGHLNFNRTGSFELRPQLYSKRLDRKIPLSLIEMQISDICDDLSGKFSINQIESLFDDGGKLAQQGSLNFIPLAGEVSK